MQDTQKIWSHVSETQGSRKHESKRPYKHRNIYKVWNNNLAPFQIARRYNGTSKIYHFFLLTSPASPPQHSPNPDNPHHHHHHEKDVGWTPELVWTLSIREDCCRAGT